jgi:hypothetical protein
MPRFPRCPMHCVEGIDLIILDSNTAGILSQLFQNTVPVDALTIYKLHKLQDDLGRILASLSSECLEYFEEIDEIVLEGLEKLDAAKSVKNRIVSGAATALPILQRHHENPHAFLHPTH